jgi:uncharacterized protein YkwD
MKVYILRSLLKFLRPITNNIAANLKEPQFMQNLNRPVWYLFERVINNRSYVCGPLSLKEIIDKISSGEITEESLVRIGLNSNWRTASSFTILIPYLDKKKSKKAFINFSKYFLIILSLGFIIAIFSQCRSGETQSTGSFQSTYFPIFSKIHNPIRPTATKDGIIRETNRIRESKGLIPLKENQLLNRIADERLKDMFQKQYFGHISPSGEKASDIAQHVGYEYKIIAENLGSISPDATDVDFLSGWMQSPGHRRNILNPEIREIGVATRKGILTSDSTIICVQIFGLAASE